MSLQSFLWLILLVFASVGIANIDEHVRTGSIGISLILLVAIFASIDIGV